MHVHPGFIWHWRRRQLADACRPAYAYACYTGAPDSEARAEAWRYFEGRRAGAWEGDPLFGAAGLGVRRPLRFLALRLRLQDAQVAQLARILERVKLEREQAAVDLRRAAGEAADALESTELGQAQLDAAAERRLAAARRVQEAVSQALRDLHRLLTPEQREELASLLRAGAIRL